MAGISRALRRLIEREAEIVLKLRDSDSVDADLYQELQDATYADGVRQDGWVIFPMLLGGKGIAKHLIMTIMRRKGM